MPKKPKSGRQFAGVPTPDPVRDRIRELIHNPMGVLRATEAELTDLCRQHRGTFAEEYMTTWPAAEDADKLFRRTREEFAPLRMNPAKFRLLCIHELGMMPRDSQAFFRFLWVTEKGLQQDSYTAAERRWLENHYDRLQARGGDSTDGWETIKARHTYVGIGQSYAEDVVSGKVPAGQFVRLACQRQLDDLARSEAPGTASDVIPIVKGEANGTD